LALVEPVAHAEKEHSMNQPELGRLGVWAHEDKLSPALARDLESMGYRTIWVGGSPGGDLGIVSTLLGATERLTVATGIVNIWRDDPVRIAAAYRRIAADFPGRFVLGIGTGHPEATSDYTHPYQALVDYLDVLDRDGVPTEARALAALGPRVLRLARDRTAAAHPYLVTPEHTRTAREVLGSGVLLAPEQKVVLEADPGKARTLGRPVVAKPYLGLSNYLANLRRLGFGDDDLAGEGSDRLIDALVASGDAGTAARRVAEHYAAGADHVAIQLITAPGADPVPQYGELAGELL
jgi:probable F420-dependent oxidoreductase